MILDFKSFVREVPDFPKPGIQFKDISPLLASEAFVPAIEAMGNLVQMPDYWVGIDARGFLFASALATRLGGGLIICRKKGKVTSSSCARVLQPGIRRRHLGNGTRNRNGGAR